MMIDKEYSGYLLVCDVCDHQVKYFDNFQDAVDYKKENGWRSRKENGEWLDICPECQEL
jgi:hypothetical protein